MLKDEKIGRRRRGEEKGEGGKEEELPFTSLGRVEWKSKTSWKCKEVETN